MAYNKEKIYLEALDICQKKKLFYIEQVVAFLPIAKKTFYEWFPIDSNECNAIKEILDTNKIEVSSALMRKWYESDNATLQMGLMKMIGTDEIRKALSTNWNENNNSGNITINWSE